MNKVYVILYKHYDGHWFKETHSIYKSKDEAEKKVTELNKQTKYYSFTSYKVKEFELK